ncbi:hypothetical protein [Nostoc sp. CALU 1950]|uniref:hypothetical protein n=1 Tax=Nostoc sp. CALU 1950 TaxID=3104321 RepID=UPI003EB879A0
MKSSKYNKAPGILQGAFNWEIFILLCASGCPQDAQGLTLFASVWHPRLTNITPNVSAIASDA